jgi:hypothetical protein
MMEEHATPLFFHKVLCRLSDVAHQDVGIPAAGPDCAPISFGDPVRTGTRKPFDS